MSKKILIFACLVLLTVFIVIFLQIRTDRRGTQKIYGYADGSGNTYTIDPKQMTIEYDPIAVQDSSSGEYTGGQYVKKEITPSQYINIVTALENAIANSATHIPDRIMGSGLIIVGEDPDIQKYILASDAGGKTEIENTLKGLLK